MIRVALLAWIIATAQGKPAAPEDWAANDIRLNKLDSLIPHSAGIIVAVIDTGIDPGHPSLKGHLWTNASERINGRDDDGNGFIDDVHGWDFVEGTGNLSDRHGHGTHIAGIIHSTAPQARIMVLKYYDAGLAPTKTIENTVASIHYAIQMGAHIINYSAGGSSYSEEEHAALKLAGEKGILVVAAAGNEGADSGLLPYYPASYPLANILSVTAHGANRNILKTSNYGAASVDISAPGEKILSALPGGATGFMTGTSQATAFVSGIAAHTWSRFPRISSPAEMKQHLLATAIQEAGHLRRTKLGVRLDAYQAVKMAPEDKTPVKIMRSKVDREPSSPPTVTELAERIGRAAIKKAAPKSGPG